MSSFRKREVQKPIPGTRTSPQTGQMITSSGNPSLDALLGGGLPIGSIFLIEEDKYVTYSKVLAKYFIAEGISSQQFCLLGSLDDTTKEILRKLPKPLEEHEEQIFEKNTNPEKNGLRIAWRYNDLPIINSEQSSVKIGHNFNLMEPMPTYMLNCSSTFTWSGTNELNMVTVKDDLIKFEKNQSEIAQSNFVSKNNSDPNNDIPDAKDPNVDSNIYTTRESINSDVDEHCEKSEEKLKEDIVQSNGEPNIFGTEYFQNVLQVIRNYLNDNYIKDNYTYPNIPQKRLSRICITSMGSPLWHNENFAKDILKFLILLRATIRNTVSVCLITMPMHLIAKLDDTLVPKIRNLVDYAIELESFAGSEKEMNAAFKEYNGLLHLHKITAINTLSAYMPETTDLAFKLRRKKFAIEPLHLPPELQETDNEVCKKSAEIMPRMGCSASTGTDAKVSLDF